MAITRDEEMNKDLEQIIEESKRLDGLATEGPWDVDGETICAYYSVLDNGQTCSLPIAELDFDNQEDLDDEGESETARNNALFTIFARTALPALVAEVERLQRVVDQALYIADLRIVTDGLIKSNDNGSDMPFNYPDLYAELKAREGE